MEQVIFGGYYDLTHDTFTEYNSLVGGYTWPSTESERYNLASANGKIKSLRVKLNDSPGIGKHYDFTLIVDGAPSALTLEIAGNDTSGNDMVNEIDITPGQTISIQCAPDNDPTPRYAYWTCVFEGAVAKESLILQSSSAPISKLATEYAQVMASYIDYTATENDFREVVPTAGTLKDFYVKLSSDPGTAPDAYRFTVRLNGATVAQSLIVTIVADDTTGSDLVHNLVVAAGDILTMMIEPISTPAASPWARWGMTFVADIDGESIVMGGSLDDLDNAATEFNQLTCRAALTWTATEAERYELGQVCVLKKLYILLSAAPGAGNFYRFTLYRAGLPTYVAFGINGDNTTGNSAAYTTTIANDQYVDLRVLPSGTPDVADAYWGLVSYRAPPSIANKSANMGSKMVAARLI